MCVYVSVWLIFQRPYRAIELIFRFPLNLTKESTTKDKEGKILKKLQALKVNDVLCALNDVFGVNFKKSEFYMSLNAGDKLSALRKLITTLARAVRVTKTIIISYFGLYICIF